MLGGAHPQGGGRAAGLHGGVGHGPAERHRADGGEAAAGGAVAGGDSAVAAKRLCGPAEARERAGQAEPGEMAAPKHRPGRQRALPCR